MTLLFECIPEDDYIYINAPDLSSAFNIFNSEYPSYDHDQIHVYVRIA